MSNKIISFLNLVSGSPIKTSKTYGEELHEINLIADEKKSSDVLPEDEGDRSTLSLPKKKKLNPDSFKSLVDSLDTSSEEETTEDKDNKEDIEGSTSEDLPEENSEENLEDLGLEDGEDSSTEDSPLEMDIDDSEDVLDSPESKETPETPETSSYDIGTLFISFEDKNLVSRITEALTESGFLADSFKFHDQSYNTKTPSKPIYKFDIKTFLIKVDSKKTLIDMFDNLFAEIGYLLRSDQIEVKVEGSFTEDLIHVIEKVDQ